MTNTTVPTEIAALLLRSHRLLAVTHVSPDGDAIGSLLGFGWIVSGSRMAPDEDDKTVALVCGDATPTPLQFLPGSERILSAVPDGTWDAVVALDASDPQRLGTVLPIELRSAVPLIVIDHHVTNLRYGDLNWVDPRAAATSQMIVTLAEAMRVPISQKAATCLLAGIVTDTRGFSTSNVSFDVMSTALRLMQLGADLVDITERALNYRPLSVLKLWGAALARLQTESQVVWVAIDRGMRAQVGAPDNGDGGLVSMLLSAPEANVAAVFNEKPDGQVEIGLRSRPGFDVSGVALHFGGGGHPQAAGCTVGGPLDMAQKRLIPMLVAVASARK